MLWCEVEAELGETVAAMVYLIIFKIKTCYYLKNIIFKALKDKDGG